MKRLITVLALVLLAGCGGGSSPTVDLGSTGEPVRAADQLILELNAQAEGDNWRVVLSAPAAADLYQLAGTLTYPVGGYTVTACQAGGGLGDPSECYFLGQEAAPGRLAFAYTRRFHGQGASGDLRLLELSVEASGTFRLADFDLVATEGELLARDSHRRDIPIGFRPGVQR